VSVPNIIILITNKQPLALTDNYPELTEKSNLSDFLMPHTMTHPRLPSLSISSGPFLEQHLVKVPHPCTNHVNNKNPRTKKKKMQLRRKLTVPLPTVLSWATYSEIFLIESTLQNKSQFFSQQLIQVLG
jgi:hypothetical protein